MAARAPRRLKRRAEFLRIAATGRKIARPGFLLQVAEVPGAAFRAGYTASRKVGNAVARNRARRRIKEALRLELAGAAPAGVEIVLVCRRETAAIAFPTLRAGIGRALAPYAGERSA